MPTMTPDEWNELINKITNNDPAITQLDLNNRGINKKRVEELSIAIKGNNYIKVLNLRNNEIDQDGAEEIGLALQVNRSITQLDLSNNPIYTLGIQELYKGIQDNSTLTELYLNNCELVDKAAIVLAKSKYINVLELGQNEIENKGINALANNKNIRYLNLADTKKLAHTTAAKAFAENYTIQRLIISGSKIPRDFQDKMDELCQNNKRKKFICNLIILARDDVNPESISNWNQITKDIKLIIFGFLKNNAYDLGATSVQIEMITKYIFENISKINAVIKSKQALKFVQVEEWNQRVFLNPGNRNKPRMSYAQITKTVSQNIPSKESQPSVSKEATVSKLSNETTRVEPLAKKRRQPEPQPKIEHMPSLSFLGIPTSVETRKKPKPSVEDPTERVETTKNELSMTKN